MPQERAPQERETKIDRQTRRRLRRWRRRAQVVAPLLALPVVLGLLILSVDLIEYQPSVPARSASPTAVTQARFAEAGEQALGVGPQNVSALSVVDATALGSDGFDSDGVASASVIDGTDPIEAMRSTGRDGGAAADAARFADPMGEASESAQPAR